MVVIRNDVAAALDKSSPDLLAWPEQRDEESNEQNKSREEYEKAFAARSLRSWHRQPLSAAGEWPDLTPCVGPFLNLHFHRAAC
jgi:hypothetical protein